ncbi:YbaB/EbfC family nucleoid-associated protein [Amycolatopsis silviterrae]|uniref:YbaB/EbfC family nucleoid-associated protein n=1 Tax=Amycolatopsis silviterrae TaxID=1656914 RepID=A0ABW5H304_9PSEU
MDDHAYWQGIADGLRALRDGLPDIRGEAGSPDGLVHATVGGRGELLALDLDPRIYRLGDSHAVAHTITEAVRAAGVAAAGRVGELTTRLLPGDPS